MEGFGPNDTARLAVQAAMTDVVARIDRDQAAATEGDVEGLHRLRAALRRLRGIVRGLAPLLNPQWADATANDCRWAERWLGRVRDLDVLAARLHQATPDDQTEALQPILEWLKARARPARKALRQGLASSRFQALRDRCQAAAHRPPTVDAAERPCAMVLPALLESAWKPLLKKGRRLDRDDPDWVFHAVRIRAKRARYAVETIAPGLPGKQARAARKMAKRATAIQDCLGALQDAVVAGEFLATAGARFRDVQSVRRLIKRLLRSQERQARQARADFRKIWKRLERPYPPGFPCT